MVCKVSNGQYVYSQDIKWDIPRRYRKLNPDALKLEEPEKDLSATVIATEYCPDNCFDTLVSGSESESDVDEAFDAADVVGGVKPGGRLARKLRRLQFNMN